MSALQDRMLELGKQAPRGWKARLAERCGIKAASISGWCSGSSKSMEHQHAVVVAEYFGVEADWLWKGKGPKLRDAANPKVPGQIPVATVIDALSRQLLGLTDAQRALAAHRLHTLVLAPDSKLAQQAATAALESGEGNLG